MARLCALLAALDRSAMARANNSCCTLKTGSYRLLPFTMRPRAIFISITRNFDHRWSRDQTKVKWPAEGSASHISYQNFVQISSTGEEIELPVIAWRHADHRLEEAA